jgi:dipeptidyl aminopeptidase/acylaminoacyl peptidase
VVKVMGIRLLRTRLLLLMLCVVSILAACEVEPTTGKPNGAIISMEAMEVEGQVNPNITVYQMFYWSEGEKAEALVTVPKKPGKYPLLIVAHGGEVYDQPGITFLPAPYSAQGVSRSSEFFVGLFPSYRGYGESEGGAHGIVGSTLDVENAIRAAQALESVDSEGIYIEGTHLGGGIALMLASSRKDIAAIVARSPFVDLDLFIGAWVKQNADNKEALKALEPYTTFHRDSGTYTVNIDKIEAPILFLQGTGDQVTYWKDVENLYKDLLSQQKEVKLLLYDGGNNNLTDKYRQEASQATKEWFMQHGLLKARE